MSKTSIRSRGWVAAVTAVCALCLDGSVHAGGMFFSARGARPLGRAGAYVAGADDLEAVYYNPAGIAGTGHISTLLDIGLVFQNVHYDRVDSGGNPQPGVDDDNAIIPIPTLGVSWRHDILGKRLTLAFAFFAPYSGVGQYPMDGPQRYSLVSLNGTAVAIAELAIAVRVTSPTSEGPQFYLGAGFQDAIVRVANVLALSGCTAVNCAPEDPNFDAYVQGRASSYFTPSANFGALLVTRWVRAGASFQLPTYVHATGTIATRLPKDPMFDGVTVEGDQLNVDMNLPWVARLGVEARPLHQLRVELSGSYEAWSMQDRISFAPQNVFLNNVPGIGRYQLGPMALNRQMQDSFGVALGGEYDLLDRRLTIRAGYAYESSAVPDQTLTVLTPDGDKHLVSIGLSVRVGRFRFDAAYGHVFQGDRTITNSEAWQLNPIRSNQGNCMTQPPGSDCVAVGNGTYKVSNDVLSVGVEGRF